MAARLSGIGFFISFSIVAGVGLGLFLDSKYNTSILWLIGLLVGITVAFWGVFRMLVPLLNTNNKTNKHNGGND